ncbi:BICD family-like cargo adapter 2 isoform X2 [Ambystoma mexicanum]|uniref:BICD family-like cargo adapter 2 isoform X2 n=1 Tax=Ambystoma mexicanum TaxID=8296 RepID=UPI0037E8A0FC
MVTDRGGGRWMGVDDSSRRSRLKLQEVKLEQEKHDLRLRLEARESEWELHVAELENDLSTLRDQLQHQRSEQRDTSREKTHAVQELSEQNQRLVEQLSQAALVEQKLTTDLHALREENRAKTLSGTDYAARLKSLQAENTMLQERRQELERQIRLLREESESSQGMVDTFQENSLLLRRQRDEKDLQLQEAQQELEESRAANRRLQLKLKDMSEELHLHDMDSSVTSIQSEIEQSVDPALEPQELAKVAGTEEDVPMLGAEPPVPGASPTQDEVNPQETSKQQESHLTVPVSGPPDDVSEPSLTEHKRRQMYLTQREQDLLAEKEEEIHRLKDQITRKHVEVNDLREELERQKVLSQNSDRDELMKQTVSDRDEAVEKLTQMKLELAQCTMERDSMSRQLMSAIRQKVALSQELEAWQDDMQVVIDQQLRSQRQKEKAQLKESAKGEGLKRTASRSFSFRRKGAPEGTGDGSGFFSFLKKN